MLKKFHSQIVTTVNEEYSYAEIMIEIEDPPHPLITERIIAEIKYKKDEISVIILNNADFGYWEIDFEEFSKEVNETTKKLLNWLPEEATTKYNNKIARYKKWLKKQ